MLVLKSTESKPQMSPRLDVDSKLLMSCDNPSCREHRGSLKREVQVLKNDIIYSVATLEDLKKTIQRQELERNEALEELAVVKAEAEIFRCDFEEERKDRERAQGFLADLCANGPTKPLQEEVQPLHAEIATIRKECNSLKIQLAKSKSLKLKSVSPKAAVHRETMLEKCWQESEFYKHEYEKERVNNADLMRSKEVSRVQIERLTEEKRIWTASQGRLEKKELTEQLAMRSVTEELKKTKRECKELLKVAEDKIQKLEKELSSVHGFTGRSTMESRPPRVVFYEEDDQYLPSSPNNGIPPPVRARCHHGDVQLNSEPVRANFLPYFDDSETRHPHQGVVLPPLTERHKDRNKYQEPLRAGGDTRLSPPDAAERIVHDSTVTSHQGMDIPRAPEDRYRESVVYWGPIRAGRHAIPMSPQEDSRRSLQGPINMYQEPLQAEGNAGQISPPGGDNRRNHLHLQAHVASGQGRPEQQQKSRNYGQDRNEMDDLILLGHEVPGAHLLAQDSPPVSTSNVASIDLTNLMPVVGDLSDAEFTSLKECLENKSHINDGIGSDIEKMVEYMKQLRQEEQTKKITNIQMPFDPNLVCPVCKKMYRIGQIQKFKKHVVECNCADEVLES